MSLLMRFRKDTQNAVISGICAGFARELSVKRKWVRIAVLISLLLMPPVTIILYIIGSVVLPPQSRWLD
ncbi:MAG: PspC domain-containing protein [Gammaproteobacteria bacterium]|nr:PspC domain-containing protein [Gammaproteobacteria bacterium]